MKRVLEHPSSGNPKVFDDEVNLRASLGLPIQKWHENWSE
jgi:hypothetical protein